jgi:hypothetical protein
MKVKQLAAKDFACTQASWLRKVIGIARRFGIAFVLLSAGVWSNNLAWGEVSVYAQVHAVFYNDVWSSPDGVNWTKHATPPWPLGPCSYGPLDRGMIVGSVSFQGKLWVIGGGSYSTTNPDCAGAGSNQVWSWDGIDGHAWVEETASAPWQPRSYHSVIVFNNQIWVMAGLENDVLGEAPLCDAWSSPDGVHWTAVSNPAPWPGRHAASTWAYNGALYVEGGTGGATPFGPCPTATGSNYPSNDVWKYSKQTSGEYAWTNVLMEGQAPFVPHDAAGALVYNGLMWLIGGWHPKLYAPMVTTNEVWNSADGAHWRLVKPNTYIPGKYNPLTQWEGRHMAGWVVFNNKMWIVGGDNNSGHYQRDIWNSSDGITWQKVTDKPQWALQSQGGGPRVLHYTVAFNNNLYVIGGQTLPETITYPLHAILNGLLLE